MATTTGLTLEEAKAKRDALKASGKTLSTSKELGKYEDLIKTLQPENYGAKTVASAQNKLATSTSNPSGSSATGINSLTGSAGGNIDLNKIYDQYANSPEVRDLESQLTQKQNALDRAKASINDNPYYSEATRTGKIAKLEEAANNEITTLTNQVNEKKADAQIRVNIATQQYNINNQQYQQNLQKLQTLISSGAIVGASSSDIAQLAIATGMSTDMIKSIIDTTKQGQVQTSVVSNTDNNGNVTVSVVNNKTGQVIASNSLGQVGQTKAQSEQTLSTNEVKQVTTAKLKANAGSDGHVSQETYLAVRNAIVAQGFMTAEEFDRLYAKTFVNPDHFKDYQLTDPTLVP